MLENYLEPFVYQAITKNFNLNDINEIRLRINEPIIISIKNKKYQLKNEYPIIATRTMIDQFLMKITNNSLYAFNDDIIDGFITLPDGVRVGLAGKVISEKGKVVTIKEFTSINIRIPHEIKNCSLTALEYIIEPEIHNTLIISPPGAGKTTFLKDFVMQLNKRNYPINTLIVDERNEICSTVNGTPQLDMGKFCDIYTGCSKEFAFKNGIRSMSPDLIITDEIDLDKDLEGIILANNSGVNIVTTIHAKSIDDLRKKNGFSKIFEQKLFTRFVILSKDNGPGTLDYIYDENLNLLYCRCL